LPIPELSGLSQTVLGPVSPQKLGPTMTHEHLLIDFAMMFTLPAEASQRHLALQPVTLENLGWIRYNYFSNKDNLELLDIDEAISEILLYKWAGGSTIVDATTIGIGRDPLALARIARATGLNIVMGAGYYVDAVHPQGMDDLTDGDIARQMVREITTGVGDTRIKAGIIGELGCSWPLTENERKVLRGAAAAQRETGASILIHPGRNPQAPQEILEVLAEAGADLTRTIMGHLDRTISDFDTLKKLAGNGCYLEYDLFGQESSYYPLADFDMPSDAQRIDTIRRLIAEGHTEQIVMAQDICTKNRLVKYGGHGYGHILENIVPRMRRKGIAEEDVQAIIVDNPAKVLAFA
jgi:phosphotriesterase-related protein